VAPWARLVSRDPVFSSSLVWFPLGPVAAEVARAGDWAPWARLVSRDPVFSSTLVLWFPLGPVGAQPARAGG